MYCEISSATRIQESTRRGAIFGLIFFAMLVGSTASAHATSCWWYYHGKTSLGPATWVGPFPNKDAAAIEARRAKIMAPSANIYVYNQCTKQKYSTNGASLGGSSPSKERKPSTSYVRRMRNLYNRVKQVLDWARRNRGRLSDNHVNIVNQYVDNYNSSVAAAKRAFPSTFRGWGSASRIDDRYKRVFYVYYWHRTSRGWRKLERGYRGLNAGNRALSWYQRTYPGYYFQLR